MMNQLPSVRRKAMDLLNNKVQQRTKWQKSQVRQRDQAPLAKKTQREIDVQVLGPV